MKSDTYIDENGDEQSRSMSLYAERNAKFIKIEHPTEISKQIKQLSQKYKLHESGHWNHADRLRAFLNDLEHMVTEIKVKNESHIQIL